MVGVCISKLGVELYGKSLFVVLLSIRKYSMSTRAKYLEFHKSFFGENFCRGFRNKQKTETLSTECFSRLSWSEKCDFKTMEINKFEFPFHFVTLFYLRLKVYAQKFFGFAKRPKDVLSFIEGKSYLFERIWRNFCFICMKNVRFE